MLREHQTNESGESADESDQEDQAAAPITIYMVYLLILLIPLSMLLPGMMKPKLLILTLVLKRCIGLTRLA